MQGWLDGSGFGNDLTAAGDPTLMTGATPTGQSAIVFDGTGDLLQRVNATDTLNGLAAGAPTARSSWWPTTWRPRASRPASSTATGPATRPSALVADKNGNLAVQGWGSANDFPSGQNGVTGGFLVQSVVLKTNVTSHYRNGVLIDSDTHAFNTDLKKLVLGAEIKGLGESQMAIGAVLIYNRALNATERAAGRGLPAEQVPHRHPARQRSAGRRRRCLRLRGGHPAHRQRAHR